METISVLLSLFDSEQAGCLEALSGGRFDDAKVILRNMEAAVNEFLISMTQLSTGDRGRLEPVLDKCFAAIAELESQLPRPPLSARGDEQAVVSEGCHTVHVKNIPKNSSEESVRSIFSRFGTVVCVDIVRHHISPATRAFVEFSSASEAEAALNFDGKLLGARPVGVDLARQHKTSAGSRKRQQQHVTTSATKPRIKPTPSTETTPMSTQEKYPVIELLKSASESHPAAVIRAVLKELNLNAYVEGSLDMYHQTPTGWAVCLSASRKGVNMEAVYDQWTGEHRVLADGQLAWVKLFMEEPPPAYIETMHSPTPVSAPQPGRTCVTPPLETMSVGPRPRAVEVQPVGKLPKSNDFLPMCLRTFEMFEFLFDMYLKSVRHIVTLVPDVDRDGRFCGVRIKPILQGINDSFITDVRKYYDAFCGMVTVKVDGPVMSCGSDSLEVIYDQEMNMNVVVLVANSASVSVDDVKKAVQMAKASAPVFVPCTLRINNITSKSLLELIARSVTQELSLPDGALTVMHERNGWNLCGAANMRLDEVKGALNRGGYSLGKMPLTVTMDQAAANKLSAELCARTRSVVHVQVDEDNVFIMSRSQLAVTTSVALLKCMCTLAAENVDVEALVAKTRESTNLVAICDDDAVLLCSSAPLASLRIPMSMCVRAPLQVFEDCLGLRADLKPKLMNLNAVPAKAFAKVQFACLASQVDWLVREVSHLVPHIELSLPKWPSFLLGTLKNYANTLGCVLMMDTDHLKATVCGSEDGLAVLEQVTQHKITEKVFELSQRQLRYMTNGGWFAPVSSVRGVTKWKTKDKCPVRAPVVGAAFIYDFEARKIRLAGWNQAEMARLDAEWTVALKEADNVKNVFTVNDYAVARGGNNQQFENYLHWCEHMNKQNQLIPKDLVVTVKFQIGASDGSLGGVELFGEVGAVTQAKQQLTDHATTFSHFVYRYFDNVNDKRHSSYVARWWKSNCDVESVDNLLIRTRVPWPAKEQTALFNADIDGPEADVTKARKELSDVIQCVRTAHHLINSPAADLEERVCVLSSVHAVEGGCWISPGGSTAHVICAGSPSQSDAFMAAIKANSAEGIVVMTTIRNMPDIRDKTITGVNVSVDKKKWVIRITGPQEQVKRAAAHAKKVIYDHLGKQADGVLDVPPAYYRLLKDKRGLDEASEAARKSHHVSLSGLVRWEGSLLPHVYCMKIPKGTVSELTVTIGLGDILHWRAGMANSGVITDKPHVDVLVDPANGTLSAGAGLSKVILDAGGVVYGKEMRRLATNGNIPVSGVVTQSVMGALKNKAVMHVVGPVFDTDCAKDIDKAAELVERTVLNVLAQCDASGYTSLALPAISSGIFGCPACAVAEGISHALMKYVSSGTGSVTDISLVLQSELAVYKHAIEDAVAMAELRCPFDHVDIEVQDPEDVTEGISESEYAQPGEVETVPISYQFQFLDGRGRNTVWTDFEYTANAACNKALKDGLKSTLVMIPSEKYPAIEEPMYRVDFESKTQTNLKPGCNMKERDIKWDKIEVPETREQAVWQFNPRVQCGDLWVSFMPADNELIERRFSEGCADCDISIRTSTYGMRKFKVDLVSFYQVSTVANNAQLKYPVRRVQSKIVTHGQTNAVAEVTPSCRVALYGEKGDLSRFSVSDLVSILRNDRAATTKKIKLDDHIQLPTAARLRAVALSYCVEIDRVDDTTCTIFGHNACVDEAKTAVEALLPKKETESWPLDWTLMTKTDNLVLVTIPESNPEFARVQARVSETSPYKLVKLERVQNKRLYRLYKTQREDMEEQYKQLNGGKVEQIKPMELFHGTGSTQPYTIYNDGVGFDYRHSTQGLWGRAAYFAVNASYSLPRYSYNVGDDTQQCFLAEVLAGHSVTLAQSEESRRLRLPPINDKEDFLCKNAVAVPRYDSVNGVTAGSVVYMIYVVNRAYPRYLLTLQLV